VLAKTNGMFFRGSVLIGLEKMKAHMWRGLFLEGASPCFDQLVTVLLEFRKLFVLIAKYAVNARLRIVPHLSCRTDSITPFYSNRKTEKQN